MSIKIRYLDYLAPIAEPDVLVVPILMYHVVVGMLWYHKGMSDIDWACHRLTSLRSLNASGVEETKTLTMAVASKASEGENDKLLGYCLDIQTPRATAFDDHLPSNEVITAFALRHGDCTGLLRVTFEVITLDFTR